MTLRHLKGENGHSANTGLSRLEGSLSCPCRCLFYSTGSYSSISRERRTEHPIAFANRKPSSIEHNYTTTEREGLAMVYALQKFRHYLLGAHFKMFTDHSTLK